jgi:hypothetical protein
MRTTTPPTQTTNLPAIVHMALLAAPLALHPATLQTQLQQALGDPAITVHGHGDGLLVTWGEAAFAVMAIDQPIPADTFETALRISYQLKDGERLIQAHRAHLIVSPVSGAQDTDQALRNAIGVMRLSQALTAPMEAPLQRGAEVLGHYWSSAQVLTDPTGFKEATTRAEAALAAHQAGQAGQADAWSGLPLDLWLGMQLIPDQKVQGYGVTSEGLRNLAGFEIAIAPYQAEAAEVARHLFNIAGYLLGSGARFNDGDTLGVSATEQFRAHTLPAEGEQPPLLVLSNAAAH